MGKIPKHHPQLHDLAITTVNAEVCLPPVLCMLNYKALLRSDFSPRLHLGGCSGAPERGIILQV